MYQFERVKTEEANNAKHAQLLADVFAKPQLFTPQFISWQYAQNPSGEIVGFNAIAENEIAAHYVAQPFYAKINGETRKGLLSLNTATHNNHRGKGLFTQLAEKTYEAAAGEGFAFVVGVANQNSVHGFLNKLGFQSVGLLDAKIGLGSVPETSPEKQVMYERIWESENLNWRLSNPSNQYFIRQNSSAKYFSRTHISAIGAEIFSANPGTKWAVKAPTIKAKPFLPFTLYIGKDNGINFKRSLFFDVPEKYKSAPLHLIFKDLTGKNLKLDFENIRFRLIDFDAY